jgi:hypothetical protein
VDGLADGDENRDDESLVTDSESLSMAAKYESERPAPPKSCWCCGETGLGRSPKFMGETDGEDEEMGECPPLRVGGLSY